MALIIPAITLASGLSLTNAALVVNELNVSNSTSISERLEIGLGADTPSSQYEVNVTTAGGQYANYTVAVFLNRDALDSGKPPVEVLREGNRTRTLSINLNDALYQGMTPRQAAYAHLLAQEGFGEATEAEGVYL